LIQPDSYAFRIAQQLGTDYLNLGFAGCALMEEEMAEYLISRKDWDFASVEMGINAVGEKRRLELAEFERRIDRFTQILAADPRPVFATSIFVFNGEDAEQELAEKLERLAELNALLNMDEKGDNVLDMGDDEPEDETGEQSAQAQEGEQDRAEDIQAVADEPLKPVASSLMSERIAEHGKERMLADSSRGRVSVKEKLAEMKQKISDQKMPEKPKTKSQEASL
jgi:hypothetical protein